MSPRSDRLSLSTPLIVSVSLHLGLAALSGRLSVGGREIFSSEQAIELAILAPEEEPIPEPPPPEPDPVTLGLTSASAPTGAWLGFETATEHLANPSEVDQPELTMDPPSGPPTESIASVESATPESPPPTPVTPPPAPESAVPTPPSEPIEHEAKEIAKTETEGDLPPPPSEPQDSTEPAPNEPILPPTPVTPPAPPVMPTPAPQPAPSGSGATGEHSDRESTASSILTAEWKKLGQPLAGQGLEIKTRRPKFTQYTRIMGAARNPIVRVHFRRDGKVERVDLIRSSGNADVDRPVIDAIYLWRATGEPLNKIPTPSPPATYPVEFRILM